MSDTNNDPNLEQLRAKAAKSDELEAKVRRMEMENAFDKAGIPVGEGQPGQLLYSTFDPGDGEITAETVLAAAAKFGITPTVSDPPTPPADQNSGEAPPAEPPPEPPGTGNSAKPGEAEFFQQAGATAGGAVQTPSDQNPYDAGFEAFNNAMVNDGAPREKAALAGIDQIMKGAAAGDQRVVLNETQWREEHA